MSYPESSCSYESMPSNAQLVAARFGFSGSCPTCQGYNGAGRLLASRPLTGSEPLETVAQIGVKAGWAVHAQAGQPAGADQPATVDVAVFLMVVAVAVQILLDLTVGPPQPVLHRPYATGGGIRGQLDFGGMAVVDGSHPHRPVE